MGLFDKVGSDAKREQELKDKIKELKAKLLTASVTQAESINAEIAGLQMQLAAANSKKS